MLKKIIAMGLSLLMLAGLVLGTAGCGKKSNSNLVWQIKFIGQKDEQLVFDEFNKRLAELLPGVQVEFKEFSPDRWSQEVASGQQIDIVWTGYQLDMQAEIARDSYLPLDEYINEKDTPNLWKEWKESYKADYASATVDGKLYAIPNQQPLIAETPYLKIPAELLQYFDLDAWRAEMDASPTMTRAAYEVLDDYFEKVWKADAYDTDTVGSSIDFEYLQYYIFSRGICGLRTSDDYVVYEPHSTKDGKVTLMGKYETESYKLAAEYAAKWYKAGYIAQDATLNGTSSGARKSVLSAHQNGNYLQLADETKLYREVLDVNGNVSEYYVMVEPKDHRWGYQTSSQIGSEATYLALPATCKNPEKAVKLIDLLRSPIGTEGNDLLNLLVYGFEKDSEEAKTHGTYHYTLEGDLAQGVDYTLQASTASLYGKPHWTLANVFLTYRTPDILEGQQEYALNYEQNVIPTFYKTPVVGFEADTSAIEQDEVNLKLGLTDNGTQSLVHYGEAGDKWESLLSDLNKDLRERGGDAVIKEMQKQVDAYIKGNK